MGVRYFLVIAYFGSTHGSEIPVLRLITVDLIITAVTIVSLRFWSDDNVAYFDLLGLIFLAAPKSAS